MSSDLRVALRIQANAGNSRREIQSLERDLRKAGKEGAKALADEAGKAGAVINKTAQAGAGSYRIMRQVMRDAATQGSGVLRQDIVKTQAELKQLGQVSRQAARDAKAELVRTDREGMQPLARSVDRADANFRRLAQNGGRHLRMLKTAAASMRAEFDRLRSFGGSAMGQLAGVGVGVGAAASLKNSAMLDRQQIRTQQTAGMSYEERNEWRDRQWKLAAQYGLPREQIQGGFDTLIASGLSYQQSNTSIDAIAQAAAVTGADSGILAKALISGAQAFNIDLSQPNAALELMQKMTVAGRLGNAELENLASIFPVIGQDAVKAGMSIEEALAFIEVLSTAEMDPSRLATLAKSSLRLFTNKAYADQVTKATTTAKSPGIQFYDENDARLPVADVYADIATRYQRLTTDKERSEFLGAALKGMDQETNTGTGLWLSGNRIATFRDSAGDISNADSVFTSDLNDNLSSADAVGGRMKATLGQAIDRMAQPLNKGFADFGSYLLDDLNLSGEQLLAGGALAGVGGYYAGRGAKAGAGALLNKVMGGPETLKNIAVGKVLEEAAGVTSVFVTNWPAGTLGGFDLPGATKGRPSGPAGRSPAVFSKWLTTLGLLGGSSLGALSSYGSGALLMSGAAVAGAGAAGYGIGTLANMGIDKGVSALTGRPNSLGGWLYDATHDEPPASGQANNTWATGVAQRLTSAALAPAGRGTHPAESRLAELLAKPLVVEVRTDSHMITAEVERRADIQMRRGQ